MNMHHLRERRKILAICYSLLVISVVFVVVAFVSPVLAQQPPAGPLPAPDKVGISGAADVPGQAGLMLSGTDPRIIVAKIIRVALGFLGTVALLLILYGGYLWMTAVGNEEQIDKAKKVLTQAAIGLVIILSAFSITQFILNRLLASLSTPPLPPPLGAPARVGGGALGSGIVESHFPKRGAMAVPRNVRVVITFKEKIDPRSFVELLPEAAAGSQIVSQTADGAYIYPAIQLDHDGNSATPALPVSALRLKRKNGIPSVFQLIRTQDIEGSVRASDGKKYLGSDDSNVDVLVSFTPDLRTFVLTPVERSARQRRALFGSTAENTNYSVYLCGAKAQNCEDGVKLLSGEKAFRGRFPDYEWSFEVGTFLDVTPPQIQNIIPAPDNALDGQACSPPQFCKPDRPRNSMVQVNFDEPVLPMVTSGKMRIAAPADTSSPRPTRGGALEPGSLRTMPIQVGSDFIAGEWQLGNQYQSAEFVSADLCGRNSCGQDVFCLPARSNIMLQVLAATLAQPNSADPASAGRFDGIEDIAGNSLDGNGNGRAQGPGGFYDRNAVPPSAAVPGDSVQSAFFTGQEILLGSALMEDTEPDTTRGTPTPGVPLTMPIQMSFDRAMALTTLSSRTLSFSGAEKATGGFWDTWWTVKGKNDEGTAVHPYGSALGQIEHGGLWKETDYISAATSAVRDLYQNCYYPGKGRGIQPDNDVCDPTGSAPYCCNGVACASGDVNCVKCGF